MKLINRLACAAACALMVLTTGCRTPQKVSNVYATHTFKVECMGTDLDGSETVRAWGNGRNKAQALETARKNAVKAVLFDGITGGMKGCNVRPVIGGVNAYERYETYFNRFFTDGGAYQEYTSFVDAKDHSSVKSADKNMEHWGAVIRVDRAGLRQRMIDDGIIKP